VAETKSRYDVGNSWRRIHHTFLECMLERSYGIGTLIWDES